EHRAVTSWRSLAVGGPLEHPVFGARRGFRPVREVLSAAPGIVARIDAPRLVPIDVATPRLAVLGEPSLQVVVVAPIVGTPSVRPTSLLVGRTAGRGRGRAVYVLADDLRADHEVGFHDVPVGKPRHGSAPGDVRGDVARGTRPNTRAC